MRLRHPLGSNRFTARGFALPLVLWLCALLALTASTFLAGTRTDGLMTRQRAGLAQARAAADAGVSLALIGVLGAAPEGPWPRDGRLVVLPFAGMTLRVSVQDELGLVDVNRASAELLAGLFRALGADERAGQDGAAAIVSWRDPSGGERRHIDEVEELGRLPAFPAVLLRRAAPFLTARNGTAAIDPVTAPGPVLRALPDLPAWAAEMMIATRREAAVLPGTLPLLNDLDQQGAPLHRFVIIRAEGEAGSGARFVREAEVELRPRPEALFRVLAWRRSMPDAAGL